MGDGETQTDTRDYSLFTLRRESEKTMSARCLRCGAGNEWIEGTATHTAKRKREALRSQLAGGVMVPLEIDRSRHGSVLLVWNECMINSETLEMTWPKLVKAMLAAHELGQRGEG